MIKLLDKIVEIIYKHLALFYYLVMGVGMFFGLLSAMAVPSWSWGAFVMIIPLVLYYRYNELYEKGISRYLTRAITIYALSLYVTAFINYQIFIVFEKFTYLTMLISSIPIWLSAYNLNRAIDRVEATLKHIELLKTLRYAMVLPLFYILLGIKLWSYDAGLYTFIPYALVVAYLMHKGTILFSKKKYENIEVDKTSVMPRPYSPTKALLIVSVICIAIHFIFELIPQAGFDSMLLFDSSFFKVALPLCILGVVIIFVYPKMECKILQIDDSDDKYVAYSGRFLLLSLINGLIAALVGFEDSRASAAILCYMPIVLTYGACLYTYNPNRRVMYVIFIFMMNLLAGFIGIAAVWLVLFLILLFMFFAGGLSMIIETISNPFGNGVVASSDIIKVWDPDLGKTFELQRNGTDLHDQHGNPWEPTLSGGFKPRGSDKAPMSGREF